MTDSAPGGPSPPPARGAPLLVTAELPEEVLTWADGLRRAHYPPERNRLQAHVTLFHALPPSAREEVRRLLATTAARIPPPRARFAGLMDLGRGTAFALSSDELSALHAELADRLHGVMQQRDDRPFRPHVTVQNKVSRSAAKALQDELSCDLPQREFRFRGLGLYGWDGRLWNFEQLVPFRGQV